MSYKNFYSSSVSASTFPFTTSNMSSQWASKGWAGVTKTSNITVGSASGTITIGSTSHSRYPLTSGTSLITSGALVVCKTGDCFKITGSFPVSISTGGTSAYGKTGTCYQYNIKKPNGNSAGMLVEFKGWIKLTYNNSEYYYPVLFEITQYTGSVSWSGVSSVDTYQPYEPIQMTVSATATPTNYPFDSNSVGTGTVGTAQAVSKNVDTYKTSPGVQTLTTLTCPGASGYTNETLSVSVTIDDWDTRTYEIVATGSTYALYTGKVVGSDFLEAFQIKKTEGNSYHTEITYPKTSLELAKMSKTVISESDNDFTFSYDISDIAGAGQTLTKTISSFHRLASGATLFSNVTKKTSYANGDVISALDLSTVGSLTYDDGTTISLADVTFVSQSMTSTVGTLPHTVSVDTPTSFSITYSMTLQYFGQLPDCTFTCTTEESAHVGSVSFEDFKRDFTAGEVITFGSNAKIKVYNENNQLVKTIQSADIINYITNVDAKYGQYTDNYLQDGVLNLTFSCYGITCTQGIYITYDETLLAVDTSNVTTKYIFDPSDIQNFEFDYTGLVAKVRRHHNAYNTTSYTEQIDVASSVTKSHDPIDSQNYKVYNVSLSYTNTYGQQISGSFNVEAEPLRPVRVVTGYTTAPSTIKYYDSGVSVFQLPQNLNVTIIFNDDTQNVVIDTSVLANVGLTKFEYYRDAEHTISLTPGETLIAPSGGNVIYVHSKEYNVDGSYEIVWVEDSITSISLVSAVNAYLGNKLNRLKSSISFQCTHISGNTTIMNDPNDYSFALTGIQYTAPTKATCLVVIPNQGSFEIDNFSTHITWLAPYPKMVFILDNFQTEYNNGVDAIYPSYIRTVVEYYEQKNGDVYTNKCDYEQESTYSSTSTTDYTKFMVAGSGVLQNYVFGTAIDIDLGVNSQVTANLVVTSRDRFGDNDDFVSANITIAIIEILNITGIKLLEAKTEYNVGEAFLNENDDTRIMIFYNDTNNTPRAYTCYLRSGLTALNIYPLKGTVLDQIVSNKIITITSATNHNVSVQYAINVKANYVYADTATHNLVALFINGYNCPDGVTRAKYFLVERTIEENGRSVEITQKNPATGEREIVSGYDETDLNVFGYLEDIGDRGKNARVILFNDYISPIEGSNNITVKFPCYVPGNADLINKCHFGIMFGNNNSKNRLFVSGNSEEKNKDWHSGQVDSTYTDDSTMLTGNYGYFEDMSVCVYGETDNAVIGYDIVANDKLLVLKDYSDKETTVYFRQPQLVTAINTGGTAVTGLDDETLYQEEFSLSKGNNSVAGVSPKSVVNFNGDSLFISHDKQIVGLDLTGIIGDNQRYANSRSYYIDEELKNNELEDAFMWSNNNYLMVVLPTKIYITHYETKHDNQYEWFVMDIANVSSILEKDGVFYFGLKNGTIFKTTNIYKDAKKVFAGYGITRLTADDEAELITASSYLSELDLSKTYMFRPVRFTDIAEDDAYIYYSLGTLRNDTTLDCDFFVDNSDTRNVFELVCRRNNATDDTVRQLLLKRITEKDPVYLNRIDNSENVIACENRSVFENAVGNPYFIKEYDNGNPTKHLYQLLDENGNVMPVKELYRCRLCMRVTKDTLMTDIDVDNGSFKLTADGAVLNIIQYGTQSLLRAFRGEIIEYSNVEAYYITKPYTMGSVEYLKTIWSFTLTNDTSIPSELDLCSATNKIPSESMKTLAYISKDMMGFNFEDFNFAKVDFDKNVVPRTYTHKRVLSNVKFVCFGFRNYKDSNSVLSSMTVTYTVPYPSYSGD